MVFKERRSLSLTLLPLGHLTGVKPISKISPPPLKIGVYLIRSVRKRGLSSLFLLLPLSFSRRGGFRG